MKSAYVTTDHAPRRAGHQPPMMRGGDETQRGKRLLIAVGALVTLVPLFAGILLVPGILLLEYLWGGVGAVSRAINNWTDPSPYVMHLGFRLGLGVVAGFAIGAPVLVWYRAVVTSGYIEEPTLEGVAAGELPVVGGYWKPVMYVTFVVCGAWGFSLGLREGSHAAAIFFGLGAVWFSYSGIREWLAWSRRRSGNSRR